MIIRRSKSVNVEEQERDQAARVRYEQAFGWLNSMPDLVVYSPESPTDEHGFLSRADKDKLFAGLIDTSA